LQIELAKSGERAIVAYLQKDIVRNALDRWYFERSDNRHQLLVVRENGEIRSHLGMYDTPEATYCNFGGDLSFAEQLLLHLPKRCVLTASTDLFDFVHKEKIKFDSLYPNDFMVVARGHEKLRDPDIARRLSTENITEYSSFGSSFNVPPLPMEWFRECLERDIIYGVFHNGKLASVASLSVWLPEIAVIMGVETKSEYRGKGLGAAVVSATVREALIRSEAVSLFVRSDNEQAISLYRGLGFKKVGTEIWIDIGTGLVP
jgi:ribosomal protein S18 acetylase RimI-like enzyme